MFHSSWLRIGVENFARELLGLLAFINFLENTLPSIQ